jgi:adenosylmethionine-8-amino-7-oxononanoate aminotransferase
MKNVSFVSACNAYRDRNGLSDADYIISKANELRAKFTELANQQGPGTVAAFICEPISGAALGCVPFVPGYLVAMKAVCTEYGALFILDEIMCGMGRCGKLHAWQLDHSEEEDLDCSPDIQMIGKALGGGVAPIAGIMISQEIATKIQDGTGFFSHGQTFQNHPSSAAAALAMQQFIEEEKWIEKGRIQGEYMASLLHQKLDSHPYVGDIRGLGTFWGIELVQNKKTKEPFNRELKIAEGIQRMAFGKYKMAIYCGQGTKDGLSGDHVMLCPAYNITCKEAEYIADTMTQVIQDFFNFP